MEEEVTPEVIKCGRCLRPKSGDEIRPGDCKCGRPTLYKPEYNEQLIAYFEQAKEHIYYEHQRYRPQKTQIEKHYETYGEESHEHEMNGGKKGDVPKTIVLLLPTFEKRRFENRVSVSTFNGWIKEYEEFSYTIELCKEIQKSILVQYGATGMFNSTVTSLILRNCHGRNDKQTLEHTGKDGGPIQTEEIISDETLSKMTKREKEEMRKRLLEGKKGTKE